MTARRHRSDVPHFVYRHYDLDGNLLYIGCTNSPSKRSQIHAGASWWWDEVATSRNTVFPNRRKALEVERHAIWSERPRCNVKGRWYREDSREDWTADEYQLLHTAAIRTANGVIGRNTSSLLEAIQREFFDRFGCRLVDFRRTA